MATKTAQQSAQMIANSTDAADADFGLRLRTIRKYRGYAIEELADLVNDGCDPNHPLVKAARIQSWEVGRNKPKLGKALRRVAEVLEVKLVWLCWGKGEPPDDVDL